MTYILEFNLNDRRMDDTGLRVKRRFEVVGPISLDDYWSFDEDGDIQMAAEEDHDITLDSGGREEHDGTVVSGYESGELRDTAQADAVINDIVIAIRARGWSVTKL